MLFYIVHELPGRLRLRCPKYYFTLEQAVALEMTAERLDGVTECKADPASSGILVRFDPAKRAAVIKFLKQADLTKMDAGKHHMPRLESKRLGAKLRADLIHATAVRLGMYLFAPPWLAWPMAVYRSIPYIKNALKSLRKRRLDVAMLDGTAIAVSLLTGQRNAASNIMYLLNVSEMLEEYTTQKSKFALADSLAMDVDFVWKVVPEDEADKSDGEKADATKKDGNAAENGRGNLLKRCPLSEIKKGDVVRVSAGSLIPLDGDVVFGEALVNQASMTGESEPVFRNPGLSVMAGTTIVEGELDIRVRKEVGESRIQQIMRLLESTEKNKAQIQTKAEHIANKLVPYSFLLFGAVWAFTGNLMRAASVLMVDYSCALRLAMPISVLTAMLQGSREHIAVRGGAALEQLAEADTIVFDKTGTITIAVPQVVKVVPMPGYERDEVLRTMACIEEHFPHSLARAIVKQAKREKLHHEEEHAKVNYIIAHGVSTIYRDEEALVGSAHFLFEDSKVPLTDEAKEIIEKEGEGYSVIYLSLGGKLAGFICIEEPPRPEARDVIAKLKQMGFTRIIMMTGDGPSAAKRVAAQVGIDEYRANLLPEDKVSLIKELQAQGRKVLMVGDGVNDSPALSQADVSVAMRDASDIARDVASISLLSADLEKLVVLRAISFSLMERVRWTYRSIISFNSFLLLMAAIGVLPGTTVALLHNGSTMAITAGNMRPYKLALPGEERKESLLDKVEGSMSRAAHKVAEAARSVTKHHPKEGAKAAPVQA